MSEYTLPPFLDQVVKEHLELLHGLIVRRAHELADEAKTSDGLKVTKGEDSKSSITPIQVLKALEELAPANRSVSLVTAELSFWDRFASSVSPITLISAVLTILFAGFGLWALIAAGRGSVGGKAVDGSAYLDIAKIFAGAIVGSASVAATTARRVVKSEPLETKAATKAKGKS